MHDLCVQCLGQVRYHPSVLHEALGVVFYIKMLEQLDAMLILIENRSSSPIPSLFRTFLEASVDLICLAEDPLHGERLVRASIEGDRRALSILKARPDHRFLSLFWPVARRERHEKEMDALESKLQPTATREKIKSRFTKAGLLDEYEGIYSWLCDDAHNDVDILTRRQYGPKGKKFRATLGRQWTSGALLPYVDGGAAFLVKGGTVLFQIVGEKPPKELETAEARITEFRKY